MGEGVELLCLYGSVTGKAESIATQVAQGFFRACRGTLEHETYMVLMDKEIESYLVQVADKANQLGWEASLCCLGEVYNSSKKNP